MKQKYKNMVASFLALFLFAIPLVTNLYDIDIVSAESVNHEFPSSSDNSFFVSCFDALKGNPNFNSLESGYVFFAGNTSTVDVFIFSPKYQYDISFPAVGSLLFFGDYGYLRTSPSSLSTYEFTYHVIDVPTSVNDGFNSVIYSTRASDSYPYRLSRTNVNGASFDIRTTTTCSACFYFNNVYNPEPSVVSPLALGIDKIGFYNWLVTTTKDSNFTSYFGLSSLPNYLSYYDVWGASPQKYLVFYNIDFGDTYGSHLSNTEIISLKNLTDRLYREYIDSLKYPPADFPARDRVNIRKDIDTTTTDNNTILITDDTSDTVLISILRDILRGVIAIKNQIFVTGTDLLTGLDDLDFTVNVANNGGNFVGTDLSALYEYNSTDFADDIQTFVDNIEEIQNIPQGYIDTINQNELMPENMLEDKNSLTVNVPCITGFTIGNNGSTYSTQTGNYTLSSSDYPWLDPIVQKIKRFGSILLIIGYLVHLRYRIPELVRGE